MKSNLERYLAFILASQVVIILLLLAGLVQIPELPACMAVDSSGRCLGAGDIVIP
jgi:uncharacterized membrane protein